jgi:hypothetical protein
MPPQPVGSSKALHRQETGGLCFSNKKQVWGLSNEENRLGGNSYRLLTTRVSLCGARGL